LKLLLDNEKFLFPFVAFIAVSLQKDFFAENRVCFLNICGNDYSIIGLAIKVYNNIAVHTPKMMMVGYVGIIPSGLSVTLNDMDNAYFGISQQGSVHRIQRDIRDSLLDTFMQGLCIGVVLGLEELLIDHDALGCDL
jgi:hypothetical protein